MLTKLKASDSIKAALKCSDKAYKLLKKHFEKKYKGARVEQPTRANPYAIVKIPGWHYDDAFHKLIDEMEQFLEKNGCKEKFFSYNRTDSEINGRFTNFYMCEE